MSAVAAAVAADAVAAADAAAADASHGAGTAKNADIYLVSHFV